MKLTPEKRRQLSWWVRGIVGFLLVWTVVAMVFPLLPSPWPPFYWALPANGQVIDAKTRLPLSGVIVVAYWELEDTGWTGSPVEEMAVMETVTDSTGRFAFRWWRPRLRWPITGMLRSRAPRLLFFKSGYKLEHYVNSFTTFSLNPFPSSNCDDAVIPLEQFQGTPAEYAKTFEDFDISLSFLRRGNSARRCEWKKIPHMLAALHVQQELFKRENLYSSIPPIETVSNQSRCGSVEKFLQGYLP
jgi:hypothetical protein